MINTVKGKVIAGVMAVALVSGGGAALGATDAGQGLKDWYNAQFNKTAGTVAANTLQHSVDGFSGFAGNVGELKLGATTSINGTRDVETSGSTDRIYQQGREYINSVNAEKAKIGETIDSQFAEIERLAKKALNTTGKGALALAEFDLKKHTGNDGKAALAHLETEIDKTTAKSIGELEWEISTTKGYLLGLLNTKSGATIVNINEAVDAEITRILDLISAKTVELVDVQKGLISLKAQELELAAKATLEQRVIDLINE